MKKIHRVKCYDRFFEMTVTGQKEFEVRKNDRGYEVGDLLELNETTEGTYTGRAALFEITFILAADSFPEGIKPGYVVLGIKPMTGLYEEDAR